MPVISVQSPGGQLVQQAPIPGLSLTLPEGVGETALVILNVPNSYSPIVYSGGGGTFWISVDGTILPAYATYTYPDGAGGGSIYVPATLVVSVPFTMQPQTIVALASSVVISGPATLSAFY